MTYFLSLRTSCRTVSLYVTSDLTRHLSTVSTNVSPATLVPHYDPDTHLLFLWGKVRYSFTVCTLSVICPLTSDPQGDNSIIAFEYVEDKKPYLFDVAPFVCGSPHQVQSVVIRCHTLLPPNIMIFIATLYCTATIAGLGLGMYHFCTDYVYITKCSHSSHRQCVSSLKTCVM